MFDLTDRPLHWIPVKWPGLAQDADESLTSQPVEHEIELRVELLDKEEAKDFFPAVFDLADRPIPEEADVFKRVVKAWRKVASAGRPVPMTDENIAVLLRVPMFGAAFTGAYISALGGQVEVREKNLKGSPSSGRAADPEQATKTASQKSVDSSD